MLHTRCQRCAVLLIVLISCCLYPVSFASFVVTFKLIPTVGNGMLHPTEEELKQDIVNHFANLSTPITIDPDQIRIATAPPDDVFFATV